MYLKYSDAAVFIFGLSITVVLVEFVKFFDEKSN